MKNLYKITASYGKTPLFFVLAVAAGAAHSFCTPAYMAAGTAIFIVFFKKPWSIAAAILFLVSAVVSQHFFIAVEVTEYKDAVYVKTGSARLYLEKAVSVSPGDMITGSFLKKKSKMFSKPAYEAEKVWGIYRLPVISGMLKFRTERSEHLFFASGGKATMAQALIFGDRRFINEKMRDEYIISGLAHLLAMSGMHVGIITAIFMTALFFLPVKLRAAAAILGVMSLIIFGAFSITVVRASVFAAVCLACYICDIKTDRKKFLLFMASFFVLFSPDSLKDISFLLSFGAVFGIVFLIETGKGFLKTALIMGTSATLLTAPLSLYAFGTTNHLSILSTVVMAPIIYVHIFFAMIAAFFPGIGIPPLILVENVTAFLSHLIYSLTYFGFVLKSIPLWALAVCIIYTAAAALSKYKWLAALSLLIIFYPSPKPPEMIFPFLSGPNKGFMVFKNGRKEIFYQGSLAAFRYSFLPEAAEYGIKTFDYGSVKIFGGENLYLKIKETGLEFTNICLNDTNDNCSVIYHTKSDSVRKRDLSGGALHIIYKSKLKDEKIISLAERGTTAINEGRIIYPYESNGKFKN